MVERLTLSGFSAQGKPKDIKTSWVRIPPGPRSPFLCSAKKSASAEKKNKCWRFAPEKHGCDTFRLRSRLEARRCKHTGGGSAELAAPAGSAKYFTGLSMAVWVLRFGHRKTRDERASMHVALVARAFGAEKIIFAGERDGALLQRVEKITKEWGGPFEAEYTADWAGFAKEFKKKGGCFAHLTMYGLGVQGEIGKIRNKSKDCLVMVGSQKVPIEAYQMADFNISVAGQPHSEIAALAIFLDRYFEGKELDREWRGRRRITPARIGKIVKMCE